MDQNEFGKYQVYTRIRGKSIQFFYQGSWRSPIAGYYQGKSYPSPKKMKEALKGFILNTGQKGISLDQIKVIWVED